MELESIYQPQQHSIWHRLAQGMMRRIRQTYVRDTRFWRIAISGLWSLGCLIFALSALSLPTGLGTIIDVFIMLTISTVCLPIAASVIAVLLSLLAVPIPRLYVGVVLYYGSCFYFAFWIPGSGVLVSLVVAVLLTTAGVLLGLLVGWMLQRPIRIHRPIAIGITTVILLGSLSALLPAKTSSDELTVFNQDIDNLGTDLVDPSLMGDYTYDYFTYGSGKDIHREAFGEQVTLVSPSVDASAYIEKWPLLRELFWGFDQSALPLNGRVWMPEGEGPFPIVLMVHGNHLMEDFSDEGYGYLGELLASKGMIAISIDENFLNYSVWSHIPKNDMKMRAWVLLKHLEQLKLYSESDDNLFSRKIDFDQIALIGHSRGGQAVAMAADGPLWFQDDPELEDDLEQFSIQAVIALAPTDTMVEGKRAKLENTNYMVLQGARDGDLNEYFGERQYERVTFDENSDAFKSYLHISDANHSQFNTTWGDTDFSLPKGLLLNTRNMLSADQQQQIAKTYVAAFLETVFQQSDYRSLFQDYRNGLAWLPASEYYSRFEGAEFHELVQFDERPSKTKIAGGGELDLNAVRWSQRDQEQKVNGIVLEWGGKPEQESSYTLAWDDGVPHVGLETTGLTFSMAVRSSELMVDSEDELLAPSIQVELESSSGISVTLPLEEFMEVVPAPEVVFTQSEWMDEHFSKGKYDIPDKPIFQTYQLPFEQFQQVNDQFDPLELTRVTLHLLDGPGKIILNDFGLYE